MNSISHRILTLAIVGTVFVAGIGTAAVYAAYTPGGDSSAHLASSAITNSECISCHQNKANEATLDPLTFSAHKKHLKTAFLRFASLPTGCGECHVRTDLEQGSGGATNKQVDATFCVTCHGSFVISGVAHNGVDLTVTDPRGCLKTGCHASGEAQDPAAAHAAAGYVNTFFASSRTYCTKCHGNLAFYHIEESN